MLFDNHIESFLGFNALYKRLFIFANRVFLYFSGDAKGANITQSDCINKNNLKWRLELAE